MNRLLFLLVVLSACASETPPPQLPQPAPAPRPADPVPTAALEEQPEPPPPEPQPIAPEQPPTLEVFAWGECRDPSIAVLDEKVFTIHHVPHPGGSYPTFDPVIQRIAPDGTVAENLRFDLPMLERFEGNTHRYPPHHLVQFGGRWPDDLFAIVDYGYRDISGVRIAARTDGQWKHLGLFGPTAEWGAVWPWANGSTLALLKAPKAGTFVTRMAVVRGSGKGPSLEGLQGEPGCGELRLEAVDVSQQGPVTALVKCDRLWLARWTPEDLQGTARVLSDDALGGELQLDAEGNGYVALYGAGLHTLRDGVMTKLDAPGDTPRNLAVDANGALWLADGRDAYRQRLQGWEKEAIADVSVLSGVEGSSPIVEDRVGDLHARTQDGRWHPIALQQPDAKGTRVEVEQVAAPAMGDVWVAASYKRYQKGRKVLRKFGVLYTTRPVQAPQVCE